MGAFLHILNFGIEDQVVAAQCHLFPHSNTRPACKPVPPGRLGLVAVEAHVRVQPHSPAAIAPTNLVRTTPEQRVITINGLHPLQTCGNLLPIPNRRGWLKSTRVSLTAASVGDEANGGGCHLECWLPYQPT